jgi:hypothetical protein
LAHDKFFRIPDAGREDLSFDSIPDLFSAWFNDYGKNKFARLRNLEDPDKYLFIRMFCRFMKEYGEMLKVKFGWLHFVKFTKFLSFTVDPKRFFHLHEEFEAVNKGWHKIASWLRKRYGRFFYIRVLELQKSGRPHLHILAVLPEWVDYEKMQELWDKKYGIGVQCRFKSVKQGREVDGLSYVLKYVGKTMTNLEESGENAYSALLFASNKRLFSIADVRTDLEPSPFLDNHHRVSATWEYQGSIYASELEAFCEEEGVAFGDFVKLSTRDINLGYYGHLFGEYFD